ncbi:MAG: ABC transporter permease [Bacteroidetes bacterium]|nr:ABC transporter permease [Bacteroidota bacterium]
MFTNHLKIAFRNILKYKGTSFISMLGLSIGMAVFLLILQYVRFEKSYENFLKDTDQIYRVTLEMYLNGELQMSSAENYPGAGPALAKELPEIIDYARLYNLGYKNNVIITNKEAQPQPIAFKQRRFLYADSSFLSLMGYNMVMGDPSTALASPDKAVISEEYAKLYFGNEDPIGKTLHLQDDDFNDELVEVTGVFENLPPNTHLKFNILFSYKTLFSRFDRAIARYDQSWGRKDMYTFIKVRPGTDPKELEKKFPAIVDKYNPDLKENNREDRLLLQSLTDIHLQSDLAEEAEANGDGRIVFFMQLIGLFVLIIAWINYINLSTARALERAREVGIRKVSGALKHQLISQFMIEAAVTNLVSLLITWVIIIAVLPWFNDLAGLSFSVSHFVQPWFLGAMALLWIIGSFLSGFYPAMVLSSFKPVSILKGSFKNTSGGVLLRKGLVVAQFVASVLLIVGTITIYQQLNYMLGSDIGVNIDQVLVVERPGIAPRDRNAFNSAIDVFRAEVEKHPDVKAVSSTVTIPGKQREYKVPAKRLGASDNETQILRFNSMDYDYMDVFEMKVLAGRAFSEEHGSDRDTAVILSESSARLLGFENPEDAIGQPLALVQFNWNPIVVGVVNDYHQVSLKKSVDPMIFYCTPYGGEYYSMRIETKNLTETVAHIEESWNKAFPGNPYEYFFLDDYFNQQYQNEQRFGNLSLVFAMLAILLGCIGLFGLSGYTTLQRTKEIGIRKVLGASTEGIVYLLSKDLLALVLLSIVLATPLAWWVMHEWLQNFAHHVNVSWGIFVLAGFFTVLVAFLTVSFQSVKAAMTNPAEIMRTE